MNNGLETNLMVYRHDPGFPVGVFGRRSIMDGLIPVIVAVWVIYVIIKIFK